MKQSLTDSKYSCVFKRVLLSPLFCKQAGSELGCSQRALSLPEAQRTCSEWICFSHEFVKTKARFPLCWVPHDPEKSCPPLRLNTITSGRKKARIFPIMKGGKRHRGSSQPLHCHTTSLGTKALLHPQDKSTFSPCSHSSREQLPSYQCWMPVKVSLFFFV